VEPEHSGKNLMLAGVRRSDHSGDNEKERESFRGLWSSFGLRSQRLASLLGEQPE
jgi:hypothetical protein